jgi:hypothetical protein
MLGRWGMRSQLRLLARGRNSRSALVMLSESTHVPRRCALAEQLLDELFLTLAPQVAGRDTSTERPGLVTGQRFAPEHPLWGTLVSVKRGGNHLFLRYAFATKEIAT